MEVASLHRLLSLKHRTRCLGGVFMLTTILGNVAVLAAPPPQVWEEIWVGLSKLFSESPILRGLEMAALGHWIWEHKVFTLGALFMGVWLLGASAKK
jgi:hypothetical protein